MRRKESILPSCGRNASPSSFSSTFILRSNQSYIIFPCLRINQQRHNSTTQLVDISSNNDGTTFVVNPDMLAYIAAIATSCKDFCYLCPWNFKLYTKRVQNPFFHISIWRRFIYVFLMSLCPHLDLNLSFVPVSVVLPTVSVVGSIVCWSLLFVYCPPFCLSSLSFCLLVGVGSELDDELLTNNMFQIFWNHYQTFFLAGFEMNANRVEYTLWLFS